MAVSMQQKNLDFYKKQVADAQAGLFGDQSADILNKYAGKITALDPQYTMPTMQTAQPVQQTAQPVQQPVQQAAQQNYSIPTYETYLKQGMTDPRVGQLQTSLNQALSGQQGFVPLQTDNIFGPKTAEALRQFQTMQSIGVDAIYGPETAGALQNYFNSLQTQQSAQPVGTQQPVQQQQQVQQYTPQMPQAPVYEAPPQYQSAYDDRMNNLLTQLEQRLGTGFQYDPNTDVGLKQAQQQAQQSVMEQTNRRGILNSTITADRATQVTQNLIPQYQQLAYGQWQDENDRLMQFADFYMGMDDRDYERFVNQWEMDWQVKDANYQAQLDQYDMQRNQMSDAWDRVEQVGYVDNETSALLGLSVGTPSQRAREIMQDYEMQIEAEQRELKNQITLEQKRHSNEMAVLAEKERIADSQGGMSAAPTPGQLANFNQILAGLSKMNPTDALRYIDKLGKEFYTKLIGEDLYNQLVNDLQTAATTPQTTDTKPIENIVQGFIDTEQWEAALSAILTSGLDEQEQISLINKHKELISLFETGE